jgi:hypothetical protein
MLSGGKVWAAFVCIFVTTVDDVVWLIPFVASAQLARWQKLVHAGCFVATLQGAVAASALLAALLRRGAEQLGSGEAFLACGSACITWLLALGLYLKKWLKRRKKRLKKQQAMRLGGESKTYGAVDLAQAIQGQGETSGYQPPPLEENVRFDPRMVFVLSGLGILDEVSYFPGLLLSGTFSCADLALGALFAALAMLFVVVFLLRPMQPLLEFFDRIPLYGVVFIYALVLTTSCVVQVME